MQKVNKMDAKRGSSLLPRILVALVVVLGSLFTHKIIYALIQGENLSPFHKIFGGGVVLLILFAIGYVIVQRMQMNKTEKFRREKW